MLKSPFIYASLVSLAAACGNDSLMESSAEPQMALHATDALPSLLRIGDFINIHSAQSGALLEAKNFGDANGTEVTTDYQANKFSQQWLLTRKANGNYLFQNGNAGKCLNVEGVSKADGARVILWDCITDAANEEIHAVEIRSGVYELRFAHSGKCLETSRSPAGAVIQSACRNDNTQRFTFSLAPFSQIQVSTGEGAAYKCLAVQGTAAGSPVKQRDCTSAVDQQFWVSKVSNGAYSFRPRHASQCLDVEGWGVDNGTQLQQYPCGWQENQQFYPTRISGSGAGALYQMTPGHVSKCLDRDGVKNDENGAQIQLWACHGGSNQQFRLPSVVL